MKMVEERDIVYLSGEDVATIKQLSQRMCLHQEAILHSART